MQSSSTLTINLSAIQKNLQILIAQTSPLMVMVKGNGYGTDQILLAKYIHSLAWGEIPYLGVAHVEEGIQLRKAGITLPVFVISAPPYQAELAVKYHLTASISSIEEGIALNLAAKKQGRVVPIHLYVDTGMNRSGAILQEAIQLYYRLQEMESLEVEGIFTHFVAAESEALDDYTYEQIGQFKQILDQLPSYPKWVHAANSAGAVRLHLPFCNLSRIGLGSLGHGPLFNGMANALTLKTHLSAIKKATKGESVGYSRRYIVPHDEARIGVIPFGYFDGFPRSLSEKGFVLVHGKQAPMIGNICMDFTMIDLTTIPEAVVGDEVILFDNELPLKNIGEWSQTDVREILVRLSPRVKREWILPRITDDNTPSSKRLSSPLCSL